MSLNKVFSVASMAALVGGISLACSSTVTVPNVDLGDSGPGAGDSGKIVVKDSGATPGDSATKETGTTVAACMPGDVSAFAFKAKPPAAANQGVCTTTQISRFIPDCIDPATATKMTCAPFNTGLGLKCQQCLLTPVAAPKYGALIEYKGYVSLNVAGCISAAEGDTTGSMLCGSKVLARDQCQTLACGTNCPTGDADQTVADMQLKALEACQTIADDTGGGCNKYAVAAQCADALQDAGGAAAQCVSGTTFQDEFNAIGAVFCGGTGPTDAGDGGG